MTKPLAALASFSILLFGSLSLSDSHLDSNSLYRSRSAWVSSEGKSITLASLRGRPVVMTMLYTSCPASCPLVMKDLKSIEKGLPPAVLSQVQFAIFSFDSKRDQPAHLKAFAAKHGVDPTRWSFYHGTWSGVRELAALLGIRYKEIEGGDFDHSNMIAILDSEGRLVYQQVGLGQKPHESILKLTGLVPQSQP